MIATAMMYRPGVPNIACSAAVPTRSCGAWAMASCGSTTRYETFARTYSVVTIKTPAPIANGTSFSGFLSSPDAKPTLFHASIENNEPTMAAPTTGRTASVKAPPAQKFAPQFAVIASAFRPIVIPSRIRAARDAVLIAVRVVWMNAAVLTPRTLIQVSSTMEAMAKMRCGEAWKHIRREARPEHRGKPREGNRDSRDRAGLNHDKQCPTIEVAEQRRDRFAQIDVVAAGLWVHRRELAIRQRTEQGHDSRQHPHEQQQAGGMDLPQDVGRHDEDAGSDHRSDDEGGGVEPRNRPDELDPLGLDGGGGHEPLT